MNLSRRASLGLISAIGAVVLAGATLAVLTRDRSTVDRPVIGADGDPAAAAPGRADR